MADYKFIVWLNEEVKDSSILGGKGANLNKLVLMGVPVPPGFVITTEAFNYFMTVNGLKNKVLNVINEVIREGKPEEYEEAERRIKELIISTEVPRDLRDEIARAYMELSNMFNTDAVAVAVRSSANAEDLKTASFAGQQDTYLNVRGIGELIKYVKHVWASTYNARALAYRDEKDIPHDEAQMAVIVQKLVNGRAAGVMFTINPVTGNESEAVIEASWGLGEAVVGGMVTPDRWVVDKGGLMIKDRVISRKSVMMVRDEAGLTKMVEVPRDLVEKPSLSDEEVLALAKVGIELEGRLVIHWTLSGSLMRTRAIYTLFR